MKIKCRAQVSAECYDGTEEFEVYDPEGPGLAEDGTWDGRSVVCDSCYVQLGTPTHAQLPTLIAAYKQRAQKRPEDERARYIEHHESLSDLAEAERDAEASPEDGE